MKKLYFASLLILSSVAQANTQQLVCASDDIRSEPYFVYTFTFDGGRGEALSTPDSVKIEATVSSSYGADTVSSPQAIPGCEKAAVTKKDQIYKFTCDGKAAEGSLQIFKNQEVANGTIEFSSDIQLTDAIELPSKNVKLACRLLPPKASAPEGTSYPREAWLSEASGKPIRFEDGFHSIYLYSPSNRKFDRVYSAGRECQFRLKSSNFKDSSFELEIAELNPSGCGETSFSKGKKDEIAGNWTCIGRNSTFTDGDGIAQTQCLKTVDEHHLLGKTVLRLTKGQNDLFQGVSGIAGETIFGLKPTEAGLSESRATYTYLPNYDSVWTELPQSHPLPSRGVSKWTEPPQSHPRPTRGVLPSSPPRTMYELRNQEPSSAFNPPPHSGYARPAKYDW